MQGRKLLRRAGFTLGVVWIAAGFVGTLEGAGDPPPGPYECKNTLHRVCIGSGGYEEGMECNLGDCITCVSAPNYLCGYQGHSVSGYRLD